VRREPSTATETLPNPKTKNVGGFAQQETAILAFRVFHVRNTFKSLTILHFVFQRTFVEMITEFLLWKTSYITDKWLVNTNIPPK
jgi:hypothetical protein